jgi:hypothetical protein
LADLGRRPAVQAPRYPKTSLRLNWRRQAPDTALGTNVGRAFDLYQCDWRGSDHPSHSSPAAREDAGVLYGGSHHDRVDCTNRCPRRSGDRGLRLQAAPRHSSAAQGAVVRRSSRPGARGRGDGRPAKDEHRAGAALTPRLGPVLERTEAVSVPPSGMWLDRSQCEASADPLLQTCDGGG